VTTYDARPITEQIADMDARDVGQEPLA